MIYFFADNHYGVNPGKVIFENLPAEWQQKITFREDDWSILENSNWEDDCELLILNMIGATCNLPHPGPEAEKRVRRYLEKGGNALLLHGSSAAFWQWDWWRQIVGFRWVRPGDPDQIPASTHPVKPYDLRLCKVRHPLAEKLTACQLPEDEIYTNLEQVCPATVLLDTFIEEGVFPQCFDNMTPWGGKFVHFIPGHRPTVTSDPAVIGNIVTIAEYLLA
jgi:hypothetical protein